MRHPLVLALMFSTSPLLAQKAAHTISPGMTRAQVIASLGEPATSRAVGEDSYLFYVNACGRKCGMNDLVVLHSDSVADAIFRSPDRHYTGKSSSPSSIPPRAAARAKPALSGPPMQMPTEGAPTKLPARMKPSPANDTRPSIPVNPPVVKTAPVPKSTVKPPATSP